VPFSRDGQRNSYQFFEIAMKEKAAKSFKRDILELTLLIPIL
jgi:hypothetical protein